MTPLPGRSFLNQFMIHPTKYGQGIRCIDVDITVDTVCFFLLGELLICLSSCSSWAPDPARGESDDVARRTLAALVMTYCRRLTDEFTEPPPLATTARWNSKVTLLF